MSSSLIGVRDHVTTNDNVELVVESFGSTAPSATVVLLIHGWSGSRRSFKANAAAIAALSPHVRVVTYDQRFHGDSAKPEWGHHVARLAADLHAVLTTLNLADVTAVGTSLGCAVLWSYVELFGQERLGQLVFVDQAPLQNRVPDWELGSKGCYDTVSYAGLVRALNAGMKQFANGNVLACATLPLSADLLAVLEEDTMKCSADDLAALMYDHTAQDWRRILPRITIPVLNVAGAQSASFPPEGVHVVGDLCVDGVNVTFERSNHWLYMEEPEKFNAMLLKFATDGERPSNGARL